MTNTEVRYDLDKALDWQLYKTCLRWELADRAEQDLEIENVEGTLSISVEDGNFVVRFKEAE